MNPQDSQQNNSTQGLQDNLQQDSVVLNQHSSPAPSGQKIQMTKDQAAELEKLHQDFNRELEEIYLEFVDSINELRSKHTEQIQSIAGAVDDVSGPEPSTNIMDENQTTAPILDTNMQQSQSTNLAQGQEDYV